MIQTESHDDRRTEIRHPAPGRIRWQREDDPRTYDGWLSDRAASSVSFITSEFRPPLEGELLQLRMPHHPREAFRVVRTTPYDTSMRFVACRRAMA